MEHNVYAGASLVAQMVKNLPAVQETWVLSPGEGNGNSIPVFLPGEFHGQRSLAGYSSWDRKDTDTPERLTLTAQYVC